MMNVDRRAGGFNISFPEQKSTLIKKNLLGRIIEQVNAECRMHPLDEKSAFFRVSIMSP